MAAADSEESEMNFAHAPDEASRRAFLSYESLEADAGDHVQQGFPAESELMENDKSGAAVRS